MSRIDFSKPVWQSPKTWTLFYPRVTKGRVSFFRIKIFFQRVLYLFSAHVFVTNRRLLDAVVYQIKKGEKGEKPQKWCALLQRCFKNPFRMQMVASITKQIASPPIPHEPDTPPPPPSQNAPPPPSKSEKTPFPVDPTQVSSDCANKKGDPVFYEVEPTHHVTLSVLEQKKQQVQKAERDAIGALMILIVYPIIEKLVEHQKDLEKDNGWKTCIGNTWTALISDPNFIFNMKVFILRLGEFSKIQLNQQSLQQKRGKQFEDMHDKLSIAIKQLRSKRGKQKQVQQEIEQLLMRKPLNGLEPLLRDYFVQLQALTEEMKKPEIKEKVRRVEDEALKRAESDSSCDYMELIEQYHTEVNKSVSKETLDNYHPSFQTFVSAIANMPRKELKQSLVKFQTNIGKTKLQSIITTVLEIAFS